MFKIYKGTQSDRFSIYCYFYINEANFYSFLYSAINLEWEDVACLLNGRLQDGDDIDWVHSIVKLTNSSAVIGEDGKLRTVPIQPQEYINGKTVRVESRGLISSTGN